MQRVIVLSIILCAGLSIKTAECSPRLDVKTLREFQGLFQDEVPSEYEVTYPYQSTPDGKFLTHDLRSSHRVRRNAENSDEHHFSLKAFGKTLHLNLRENKDLVSPGLVLESYANGKVKRTPIEPRTHYFGRVRDHPGSTVAVSNHGALSGKIVLNGETLYIQPVPKELLKSSDTGSPHFIYKPAKNSDSRNTILDDIVHRNEAVMDSNIVSNDELVQHDNPKKYYLELCLAAHEKVATKYGDLTADFLLTMSNIAAQAFQDPTIGENKITLVVTRLVIISADQLNASSISTGVQLSAFEKWVRRNNPSSDSDPKHFDIGAYMRPVGGGGLASMGTVCRRVSANVISDNGLGSWAVLAHEVAHNLGIGHDVDYKCPGFKNIMAGAPPGGQSSREWSNCTKKRFTELFNANKYTCLLDVPQANPKPTLSPAYQGKLPGVLFDKKRQCQMRSGPKAIPCRGISQSHCRNLYCATIDSPSSCTTNYVAIMDGTRCGVRHWCMKAKCVDDGSPIIHGGWSSWSADYIPCTRSCGRGIKYKTRSCSKPAPQNGGDKCKGLTKGYIELCNTQKCPLGVLPYLLSQCKDLHANFTGYRLPKRSCNLQCTKRGYAYPKGIAKDGSRCDPNPTLLDVCIEGKCLAVGCDHVIGSDSKRDRCGVCNGDGTGCELVNGSYTKDHRIKGRDNADTIVVLPVGAVNITVTEREAAYNLIGVTNMAGKFLFSVPNWSQTRYAAGTKIIVAKTIGKDKDHVFMPGPITEQLKVVYIFRYGRNKGVDYEFYKLKDASTPAPTQPPSKLPPSKLPPSVVPTNATTKPPSPKPTQPTFKWQIGKWSECSQTCAVGSQSRLVQCVRQNDKTPVSDKYCPSSKPAVEQDCNPRKCPPEWHLTGWILCSKSCGKGNQSRSVSCRQEVNSSCHETLSPSKCDVNKKPKDLVRDCNALACPPELTPKPWSTCSTSCGEGVMTRALQCTQTDEQGKENVVEDEKCKNSSRLPTQKACNQNIPCHVEPPPQTPIACFKLNKVVLANSEVLADFRKELDWSNTEAVVKKCRKLAYDRDYTHFALGNNGNCYSGKDFDQYYFKGKAAGKKNCKNGVGKRRRIYVYRLDPLPEFQKIDCYPASAFAYPYYASFRGQINWKNMTLTVLQCAHVAYDLGHTYFGIRFYGECYSAPDDEIQDKLETLVPLSPDKCWSGVGKERSHYIYDFEMIFA